MLWGTYVLTEDREAEKLSRPSVFKLFKHTFFIHLIKETEGLRGVRGFCRQEATGYG